MKVFHIPRKWTLIFYATWDNKSSDHVFSPKLLWKLLLQWIHRLKNSGETGPLPVTLQMRPVSIGLEKCFHSYNVILWWKETWILRFPLEGNARWIVMEWANAGFPGYMDTRVSGSITHLPCRIHVINLLDVFQHIVCPFLSLIGKKKNNKLNYAVTTLCPIFFVSF